MNLKNKIINKLIMGTMILLMFLAINPTEVLAAGSFSVSGGGSGAAGASKTVTVSAKSCAGQFAVKASGGGSVSTTMVFLDNGSTSITVKLPSSGSTTVTVTAVDVTDFDEKTVSGSKSVTYTVNTSSSGGSSSSGSTSGGSSSSGSSSGGSSSGGSSNDSNSPEPEDDKSSNNKLSKLSVSEGTLSPKFASDTTSYKVNVLDVSSIEISGSAADSKAKVSGTGTKELKLGDNSFSIVVTAENGSKKTYKIVVNLDQSPTVFTEYEGQKLGVVKNTSVAPAVDNTEETKVYLGEDEIPAWNVTTLGVTIAYLIDEEGNADYYIYEDGVITSQFVQAAILGRNVVLIDVTEEAQARVGLTYQEVTVDAVSMYGWVFEDLAFDDYVLIRVMDDQGQEVEYLYCISDNSMIPNPNMATVTSETVDALYSELEVEQAKFDSAEANSQAMSVQFEEIKSYLMIALIVIVILLILLLIQFIVGMKRKKAYKALLAGSDSELLIEEYADESLEEVSGELAVEVEDVEPIEIYDVDDDDIDVVISGWDESDK